MAKIGTNTSSSSLGDVEMPYELAKRAADQEPVHCSAGEAGNLVDSGLPGEGGKYEEIVRTTLLALEEKHDDTPNHIRRLENLAKCVALLSFAEEQRKRIVSKSAKDVLKDIRRNPKRYESAPPKQAKDIITNVPRGANPIAAALCPDEEYGCSDSDLQPFDSLPLERRRLLVGCDTLINEWALPPSFYTPAERKLIFPMAIFHSIEISMIYVLDLATNVLFCKTGVSDALRARSISEIVMLQDDELSPTKLMETVGGRISKDLGARLSETVRRATAALESEFRSENDPNRAFLAVLARALAHLNFEERLRRHDVAGNVLDLADDEDTDPVWNAEAKESKDPETEPLAIHHGDPVKIIEKANLSAVCGFDVEMIRCIKNGESLARCGLITVDDGDADPEVVEGKWGRKAYRLLMSMLAYRQIARALYHIELAMYAAARGASGKEDLPHNAGLERPQSPDLTPSSQNERKENKMKSTPSSGEPEEDDLDDPHLREEIARIFLKAGLAAEVLRNTFGDIGNPSQENARDGRERSGK